MRFLGIRSYLSAAVAFAIVAAPGGVGAQCAFNRPSGSSSNVGLVRASLVRAFVSCYNPGGNAPNVAVLGGGVPACQPVEDFHQQDGSPTNGWEFDPGSSYGRVQIKRTSGGANLGGFPATSYDAAVTLKLYHIGTTSGGGFANGNGTLRILLRMTFDDYLSGDVTAVDFPFAMPFTLAGGYVSVTKKVGDILGTINVPRLPDCTSLEVVSIDVRDPNGNIFAVSGVRF